MIGQRMTNRDGALAPSRNNFALLLTTCGLGLSGLLTAPLGIAGSLTPASGYTISTFATNGAGYSQPDSIAVDGSTVWVGYGNGVPPDGSSGSSTIVEYSSSGAVLKTFTVAGHNDGLKVNPSSGQVWAMQNEDANPYLTLINPSTGTQTNYTFGTTPHGGGYDDMVFYKGQTYISASNPTLNTSGINNGPAIVSATISGTSVGVTGVLPGNGTATNIATGLPMSYNLTDPDSMTLTSTGSLALDSQADQELVFVSNPGPSESVRILPLSNQIDDTWFISSTSGELLLTDQAAGIIYAIRGSFVSGEAFSAANVDGFLGSLNLSTGVLTPVVSGLSEPKGLAFLPSVPEPPSAMLMLGGLLLLLIGYGVRTRINAA